MKKRSPIQRFLSELRRRHVPQTAAIYMVAAWAAIQFADVVVPNLDGPQWVVTAVIVAAAVGLPVVLALAWIFEWGPEGIHRTESEGELDAEGRPIPHVPAESSGPWVTTVAVLLVAIASALGVAVVLDQGDEGAGSETRATAPFGEGMPDGGALPGEPPFPGVPPGILSPEYADSVAALVRDFSDLRQLEQLAELRRLGERVGRQGRTLLMASPVSWSYADRPEPLAAGDTLRVIGVALDSAGVVSVSVDGAVVAETDSADAPELRLPFNTSLVGTGSEGRRTVPIVVRTRDGREIVREFPIQQMPGG